MELSIKNAQDMVGLRPVEISELRNELADHHADEPQRAMLADLALQEAETAIGKLRALGHHFFLARGDSPEVDEFPKMLYRDSDLAERTVANEQEEAQAREEGFNDHAYLRKQAENPVEQTEWQSQPLDPKPEPEPESEPAQQQDQSQQTNLPRDPEV